MGNLSFGPSPKKSLQINQPFKNLLPILNETAIACKFYANIAFDANPNWPLEIKQYHPFKLK